MKRALLLLLLAGGLLPACHNGNQEKAQHDTASAVVPLLSTPYYYTQLKGAVDGRQITMELLKTAPNLFRGYYYYDSTGLPISIWGSQDADQVKIYEDNGSREEERFFGGSLGDDGTFKGVWHGDSTSYHFELHTDLRKAQRLQVYYDADSVKLLPSFPNSPLGIASNSILWPDSATDSTLAAFLRKAIAGDIKLNDPRQFVKRAIDSFVTSYRIAAKDADSSDIADGESASWNWTTESDMKVVYNSWPLLVIEKYAYDFTGGAHGNSGAFYQTLDLAKRKVVTPDEYFKPGYKEVLSPLLDKAFRKKFHIDEDESLDQNLLVKTIVPNNNFIVTGKGVAFSYVPYEIGPYALGQVTLFIPFTELKSILK
ncbi:DUF3298 and DUF4163 domain-containing protein [Chitinophaga varians]|uniref:DUF3298 and DUF4163 domain-containing protein n=1 Tax=Chitinophaga varians TaxID=2202339 RepID=A0A847RPY6_9BACT|nr:DUF3298 and DUF4163 domain-containing protein [Chitinophaga varians]NLR65096.1 DUF3298 and DUF4163 domain-containing protein [Chitinophaga varians]